MAPEIITLIILGVAIVLFFTEVISLPVTAMLVPIALSLTGILDPQDAFANFGNRWVVIFMAMFMVSEAIFKTGFAGKLGDMAIKMAGQSYLKILLLVMLILGVMSAFLSNTGSTAVFIPVVLAIALSAGIDSKKLLMPMAFASSLGGTLTAIGTPPNGIVNGVLETYPEFPEFGFFEFGKVGIFIFIAGILYMVLMGNKLVPGELKEKDGEDSTENTGQAVGQGNRQRKGMQEEFQGEQGGRKAAQYGKGESEEKAGNEESHGQARDGGQGNLSRGERPEKMWVAVLVFLFVVVSMATGFIDLQVAAMLGAMLTIITGCITMEEAFNSISWTTIFLFAGMLSMSEAMEATGAAALIADGIASIAYSPMIALAVLFLTTAVLTNFMSNTATGALFAPIGISLAGSIGVSPFPFLMGVAMAASCCFLTPIATPPNTLVLGPAGYNFMDYLKAGWPLQLISFLVAMVVIPIFFPF